MNQTLLTDIILTWTNLLFHEILSGWPAEGALQGRLQRHCAAYAART